MGSWTEQAAARAVEMAEELTTPLDAPDDWDSTVARRIRVAAHLTYLAGLIRGLEMTVHERPTIVDTWEQMKKRARDRVPASDNDSDSEYAARGIIATERRARLRAERERDELLAVARMFVTADDSESGKYALQLADVVARIDKA